MIGSDADSGHVRGSAAVIPDRRPSLVVAGLT
jgi:hypothetical protein